MANFEVGELSIPTELPILPLRGVVVYPMMWLPLTVGQERSVRLVDDALVESPERRFIGLITSREMGVDEPSPDQIHEIGTVAIVHRMLKAPDGTIRLIVQGIERIRAKQYLQEEPYLRAEIELQPDVDEASLEQEALMRTAQELFRRLVSLVPHMPEELETAALNATDARQLAYLIAASVRMEPAQAQEILEIDPVREKLVRLNAFLNKELEVLELGRKIQSQAQDEMSKMQREYFLREQLKAIQKELGEGDEQEAEIQEFETRITESGMPEEAEKEARRELDRMRKMPSQAAEYSVIKTYLDWMVSLPWSTVSQDNLDIGHARAVLDEDHYGLDDIKKRILEFLAVRKLRSDRKDQGEDADLPQDFVRREREGVILCFVGPPGTGKTSLGRSIARAMGRKFVRLALGGIRDEAEIRGFRRTYIGSMPGRVVQSLRRVETRNPVFMLDEVDKLGHDFPGRSRLGAAGGARSGAERGVPGPLPRRAVRPEPSVLHHHGQLAGSYPAAAARSHGDHRAAQLHRGGEGQNRRGLPGATADQGDRSARQRDQFSMTTPSGASCGTTRERPACATSSGKSGRSAARLRPASPRGPRRSTRCT